MYRLWLCTAGTALAQPAVPVAFRDLQQYRLYAVAVVLVFAAVTQQQPGLVPFRPTHAAPRQDIVGALRVFQTVGI